MGLRTCVGVGVVAAMLGGCSNVTEPTHSASGTWRGVLGSDMLTLSLDMHRDHTVSGTGTDSGAAGTRAFPVHGTVSGSTVFLLFTPRTVESGFSGRFTSASQIEGAADLPGLGGEVSLARQ